LTVPNTSAPDFGLYTDILQTLEAIQAPYMIIGAFAATAYGSARTTYDIDIVVDLQDHHIGQLVIRYPPPRYYADPVQMRDSIHIGIMFNIIDTTAGKKADLVPLSMDARYRRAFDRRVRQVIQEPGQSPFEAWLARPEDVILGKLMAWAKGRSYRHEEDIYSMLVFIYLNADPELSRSFDQADVDAQAARLGSEASQLWKRLKEAARCEVNRAS
jgi:hypothetical protein